MINSDIFVLCETHLKYPDEICLKDYKTFTHNRHLRNIRSSRTFGGLAVLVKMHILDLFDVSVIDKSIDGLYILKFFAKDSDYTFILIACYLPPERSPWGRDASGYFSQILNIIHTYACCCDSIYLCGDLNSRMGEKQDYVIGVDDVVKRKVLDKYCNKHGETFYEFLIDSKMCVLNGRITPDKNDFTYVSTRGKSVVDYFAVPIANIDTCLDFTVVRPMQLLQQLGKIHEGQHETFNIDHSLLSLVIVYNRSSKTLANSLSNVNLCQMD